MTREGDCSETMRSATLWQYTSQSGFAIVNGPVKSGLRAVWVVGVSLKGISVALTTAFSKLLVPGELSVGCPRNLVRFFSQLLVESRTRHALLHAWERPSSGAERNGLSIEVIRNLDGVNTSSSLGAATRIRRHRLLIGAMSRLVLLAQRIIRILDMYFSIVRLKAAWASRDNESASLIMTTGQDMLAERLNRETMQIPLKRCFAPISTCWVWAISFNSSWITTLS